MCLHESVGIDQGSASGIVICWDCGQEFVPKPDDADRVEGSTDQGRVFMHATDVAKMQAVVLIDPPERLEVWVPGDEPETIKTVAAHVNLTYARPPAPPQTLERVTIRIER